jgi:hypothetical protein
VTQLAEIHLGDVGTDLIGLVKEKGVVLDISAATDMMLYFKPPSGTVKEETAALYTDGTDGKLVYTTVADWLDEIGIWEVQAGFALGSWSGRTSVGSFPVFANL